MAEQIIIEFQTDTTGLESANDTLEQQGKISKKNNEEFKKTNYELLQQQKALQQIGAINKQIEQSGKVTKKNLSDLAQIVKSQSAAFRKEFQNGIIDGLKEAGVTIDEFTEALENSVSPTVKQRLKELVLSLAEMKAAGEDNTEQYRALAEEAGRLKDAIGDANQEIKNFGSDTSTLDGVLSLAGGVAGGFAAMQGAAALFGDESEELQQTLLRVNAAMAILQGLQQLQVVLQKESAAATLANTIATKAQTAATVIYNFVVGSSIGLMKAFRIALAATGIGLAVILILELVEAFKKSNEETRKANQLLEQQKDLVEAFNKGVQDGIEIEQARAEAAGKAQSDIIRIQGRGLQLQKQTILESNQLLSEQQKSLSTTSEAWGKLNAQILENNLAVNEIDNQVLIKRIELEHKVAEEALQANVDVAQAKLDAARKNSAADFALQREVEKKKADLEIFSAGQNSAKILEIRAGLNKKIRDIDRAEREQRQKEILAGIETQLIEVQNKSRAVNDKLTQEEVALQKKKILATAAFEAEAEGLSQKQRLEILAKGNQDALELQRSYNRQLTKDAAEEQISRNKAELTALNISEADKLQLIEDNLALAADLEIQANQGNSAKIKEINRQLDADIRAARLASLQATLEYEIALERVHNAETVRMLEKSLSDQDKLRGASSRYQEKLVEKQNGIHRQSLQQQLEAVDQLTALELQENFKRTAALNEELQKKLISQKDYDLQYNQLIDDQTKIVEDSEKRKTEITIAESEKRKQRIIQEIQTVTDAASEVVGVLDALFQLQAAKENIDLEQRKNRLKELRDAGAITEKEAIERQKRLEADERRIRQQQAQREKSIAVFNAAIAVPQAALKGLVTGGPILAAVYGALAAVQFAIVASRPVPKFGKGKKNKYQGLAEVGETGTELIESNGKMYVADKRQIVWLGKDDKVFNPQETIQMLGGTQVNTEKVGVTQPAAKGLKIDYEKFGKAVAKHVSTNVYVDGIKEQQIKQQQFTEWQTKRRAWG